MQVFWKRNGPQLYDFRRRYVVYESLEFYEMVFGLKFILHSHVLLWIILAEENFNVILRHSWHQGKMLACQILPRYLQGVNQENFSGPCL